MPPIEKPPNGNEKSTQERLRLYNQVRRSLENQNSLSTITEEAKSSRTMTSSDTKAMYSDESGSDEFIESLVQEPIPDAPVLRKPPTPRKKRHTSIVVRGAPQQVIIPHEEKCVRTPEMKQELLDHLGSIGRPLFETVTGDISQEPAPSILVTGFGIRNLASLQAALQRDEQKRLDQIYKTDEELTEKSSKTPSLKSSGSSKSDEIALQQSESTTETQTELYSGEEHKEQRLSYLMGLTIEDLEEEYQGRKESVEIAVVTPTEEAPIVTSVLMRKAQKYLREHKIFEFFQFIIAHLLSALPENPIEFITDLLDECMTFRSGLTKPPLLYDKKHLESLFYLMDKMRTGFIELEQYKTGMRTVGVCSYNPTPPLTSEGMVSKTTFIEEAYDCLTELLNDLLRRRWIDTPPPKSSSYIPTPQLSIISSLEQNVYGPLKKTKCIIR